MSDPIEACQMEFDALSELQLRKHTAENIKEKIESIFAGAISKRTWYATFAHKLESEIQSDKITFKVLHTPDYLSRVYIVQQLPALRIKDQWKDDVQICWPHNVGNNITAKGDMVIGSSNIIQSIDSRWMDDYLQLLIDNGYEQFVKDCQGNHEFLENWSTYLPSYTLSPIQPYFIEADTETAFPIYRIAPETEISFKYKIIRNFRDLLRMRKKHKGVWKEMIFNKSYIEGNYEGDELPLPSMWGIYFKISKGELDSFYEPDYGASDFIEQVIDDVLIIEKKNKYNLNGGIAEIEMESGHPCRLITLKAVRCNYEGTRNFSNYTTDIDVYKGWSPIKRIISLNYGPVIKMEDIDECHTSRMFPFYHCARVPYERGYNIIPFSSKLTDFNFDVGVILSNLSVKMHVELGDTNPMLSTVFLYQSDNHPTDKFLEDIIEDEKDKEEANSDVKTTSDLEYRFIVRALISKTLVYKRIKGTKYYSLHFKKHNTRDVDNGISNEKN